MNIAAIVSGLVSAGLMLGGHWVAAIAVYLGAGYVWVRHDRRRPLGELPVWVAGGSLVSVLVLCLWPIRALEAAWQWRRVLRSPGRYVVGNGNDPAAFASWTEALDAALDEAKVTGQAVPVCDRAWLTQTGPGLRAQKKHRAVLIAPDGTIERPSDRLWWW